MLADERARRARVVEMDVAEQEVADVGQREAAGGEPGLQRVDRRGRAAVEERRPVVGLEEVARDDAVAAMLRRSIGSRSGTTGSYARRVYRLGMALRGGIDLGGTKIEAVVVDDASEVLGSARRETPRTGRAAGRRPRARRRRCARRRRRPGSSRRSSPASASARRERSTAKRARSRARGNLPGWADAFPLAARSARSSASASRSATTCASAVEAERVLGAGRTYRSFLGVWWGTGIGGAVVFDGRLWLGRGSAGELGHIVVRIDGAPCPCGRKGCLEAYAGRARDGAPRAARVREGREDGSVRADAEEQARPPDERRLGGRARARRRARDAADRPRRRGRSAPVSARRSICSTSRPS